MYINTSDEFAAFFGTGDETIIENFNITGKIMYSLQDSSTDTYVAGIMGFSNGAIIRNCTNDVEMIISTDSGFTAIGGIAGWIKGSVPYDNDEMIINCNNYGNIEVRSNSSNTLSLGGIIGYSQGGVNNSNNYGNIVALLTEGDEIGIEFGGIIGWNEFGWDERKIFNCKNYGNLKVESLFNSSIIDRIKFGGIVGDGGYETESYNFLNEGNMEIVNIKNKCNEIYVGSLIGEINECNLNNSYNRGNIIINNCILSETEVSTVGGIAGGSHYYDIR